MAVITQFGKMAQTNIGMTKKLKTYFQPKTTDEILRRIAGLTMNDLVIMRLELAEIHLIKSRGKEKAEQMQKNQIFWNWWLRIWEITDKQIIDEMNNKRWDFCNIEYYRDQHITKCTKMKWVYKIGKESVSA